MIKVKQAVGAYEVLEKLIKDDSENKLVFTGAVRIRLSGNLRRTREVFVDFVDKKNGLIKKYGAEGKDKDGNASFTIKSDSENKPKFDLEFKDMLNEDCDFDLKPILPHELAGVTKEEYDDPKANPKNQNQLPIEFVALIDEVGLLKT